MNIYRCVKTVQAFKIDRFLPNSVLRGDLILVGYEGDRVEVSEQWAKKHSPHQGGYYVLYKDGYASYSPAEPFEEGYVLA